ncbi:MAG TPA: glycosyl hydrolase family 28-related protein [Ignavibacteriaceae bacterium]|nr:glycosyl hydrolase family 28-related protein [Ignavibacteriaceae bacterium]
MKKLIVILLLCLRYLYPQIPAYGNLEIFNVKELGAKGDDINDDTKFIQQALDNVYKKLTEDRGGGGAVYFPPGHYRISKPLQIPPRCMMFGLSGSFTQSGRYILEYPYYKHLPVVIRLMDNANCNMVEPYEEHKLNKAQFFFNFESVTIENICLDGNKENQSPNAVSYGIHLPDKDLNSYHSPATNLILRDVMIYNFLNDGFYGGQNQNEVRLFNVISKDNGGNGFTIYGQDYSINLAGAAANAKAGFEFKVQGGVKAFDVDSWGNKWGVVLDGITNGQFIRLQCDNNEENGLLIKDSHDLSFVASVFSMNSKVKGEEQWSGLHSEVLLLPNKNGFGPLNVNFISCKFGQWTIEKDIKYLTSYGIEDRSTTLRANSFISCSFKEKFFRIGIANDNVFANYNFTSCSAGPDGEQSLLKEFIDLKGDYKLSFRESTLKLSERNINVNLPDAVSLPVGKRYSIISKYDFTIKRNSNNDYINSEQQDAYIKDDKLKEYTLIYLGKNNNNDDWIIVEK